MVRKMRSGESRAVAEARATSFGTRPAKPGQVEAVTAILDEHTALGDFACFVVDDGSELVAFGVGMIHQRLPADHNPSGRWGYVQTMETHPHHRRKGYATAIVRALQDWYRTQEVPAASLIATDLGEPVYRRNGFGDERFGKPLIWLA